MFCFDILCCFFWFYLQVLLDQSGSLITSPMGFSIAIGPDSQAMIGPDGTPLCLGPDKASLITGNGHPILGPQVGGMDGNKQQQQQHWTGTKQQQQQHLRWALSAL